VADFALQMTDPAQFALRDLPLQVEEVPSKDANAEEIVK
jgi:hypothetical protein